jgi:hypothetical protein
MSLTITGQEDVFVLETPRGRAEVDLRRPGLAEIRYAGLATGHFPRELQPRLDRWIAAGKRVSLFIDAVDLKSYDTEFRSLWAAWMRTNRAQIDSVHILFKSKLVEMGIAIVNPFVGGFIEPWSDRAGFEAALNKARDARPRASGRAPKPPTSG